jgi:hypothetical protein
MNAFSQKILKPWGYEILLTPPDSPIAGKIAFTKAGHKWSFQYHDLKNENICLVRGKAEFWLENDKGEVEKTQMELFKGYRVKPFKKHRFCAITNCLSVEISTKEEGSTVRLEDDYGRGTETEETRQKRTKKGIYVG